MVEVVVGFVFQSPLEGSPQCGQIRHVEGGSGAHILGVSFDRGVVESEDVVVLVNLSPDLPGEKNARRTHYDAPSAGLHFGQRSGRHVTQNFSKGVQFDIMQAPLRTTENEICNEITNYSKTPRKINQRPSTTSS